MCQEVVTEDGKRLTTARELAGYLNMDCSPEVFLDEFIKAAIEELTIDWRDCCLCGVDIEQICVKAGKQVKWDDDPMVLLILKSACSPTAEARE